MIESEFPYEDSRQALHEIQAFFKSHEDTLQSLAPSSDPATVAQACRVSLLAIYKYLPILGFILRSTNVRNAFEVFGPFVRLCGDILEPGIEPRKRATRLLLSSEWDYSPFIFQNLGVLPDFVLIGLPAPESANPLLLPVAGHELGHSIWAKQSFGPKFHGPVAAELSSAIESKLPEFNATFGLTTKPGSVDADLTAIEAWIPAAQWCLSQCEETFCDFVGLRIFGESYLKAFAYLLAPSFGTRSKTYPSMAARTTNLMNAATELKVAFPPDYAQLFENESAPKLSKADKFRLDISDRALEKLIPVLLTEAKQFIDTAKIPDRNSEDINRILQRFALVVPAEQCASVADVLNAGWMAQEDADFWKDEAGIQQRKNDVLKELVLKNLELFEIEQMLKS